MTPAKPVDLGRVGPTITAIGKPRILPTLFTVLPAILLVLIAYVWLVSIGTWTQWPRAYDYSHHDQLASAFRKGQLHLLEEPSAALLGVSNPYDPHIRGEIPYVIDASLYGGKYYLYFGPVPALLLVGAKVFISNVIPDIYLVFVFTCAIFLTQTAIILSIQKRFFPAIPAWLVLACILFLGLSTPFGWILGSQAAVHNASIAAGQFFFLAGLFAAFEALAHSRINQIKATIAGVLWAAAIGSRITQIVPVAAATVLFLVWIFRGRGSRLLPLGRIWEFSGLAIPLIVGAAALGWYNWARFGSVLESGITYQLAMWPLQQYSRDLFSVQYVFQNLHNYIINPPRLRYAFPYVWPQIGLREPVLSSFTLPEIYFTEENIGLLFDAPFLVFAFAAVFGHRRWRAMQPAAGTEGARFRWLVAALGGAFISGFGVFLLFFWASNRYVLDFLPPLLLLSVIGFWHVSESSRSRQLQYSAVIALGLGLIAVSIIVSALLAVGQNAGGFSLLNPELWRVLNKLFR